MTIREPVRAHRVQGVGDGVSLVVAEAELCPGGREGSTMTAVRGHGGPTWSERRAPSENRLDRAGARGILSVSTKWATSAWGTRRPAEGSINCQRRPRLYHNSRRRAMLVCLRAWRGTRRRSAPNDRVACRSESRRLTWQCGSV